MIRKLLAWLRAAYRRVNGFLESVLGDMGFLDDEEIKRLMGGYEKSDRERRRCWAEKVKKHER